MVPGADVYWLWMILVWRIYLHGFVIATAKKQQFLNFPTVDMDVIRDARNRVIRGSSPPNVKKLLGLSHPNFRHASPLEINARFFTWLSIVS